MKNAMQLKVIIKNLAKEKHISAQLVNAEFYVGEVAGTNIYFKISTEFYLKRRIPDCGDGGA